MLSTINDLLSKLPFNGKKTVISAISALLAWYLPQVDPKTVDLLGSTAIEFWRSASELYLVIGIFHGQVKKSIGVVK